MDNRAELEKKLRVVFEGMHERSEPDFDSRQHDFVFHMLDWVEDLNRLHALVSDPSKIAADEAERVVQEFLYHAAGHIAAAARLYDEFRDPFVKTT